MASLLGMPDKLLLIVVNKLDMSDFAELLLTCHSLFSRLDAEFYRRAQTFFHEIRESRYHMDFIVQRISVLEWAAKRGRIETIQKFLAYSHSTRNLDKSKTLALWEAAEAGMYDAAEVLIKMGANVSGPTAPIEPEPEGEWVKRPDWTKIPLHAAARWGHEKILCLLLDHGADASRTDHLQFTALDYAVSYDHEKSFRILFERSKNLELHTRTFHIAVLKSQMIIAKLLLETGIPVDAHNENGETPLSYAYSSSLDMIRFLLENGADCNVQAHGSRSTPLSDVLNEGPKASADMAAKILLEHGADPNLREANSWAPLHWAVEKSLEDSVKLLLAYNADVNAIGVEDPDYSDDPDYQEAPMFLRTPLDLALSKEDSIRYSPSIVRILRDAGGMTYEELVARDLA